MKRKFSLLAVVVAAMALVFALSGCSLLEPSSSYTPEEKSPTVASPVIGQDGVLRVGVNSSNAPFSAQVSGNIVGIDIDIAAALADQLGLDLQIVDVGTDPEGALAEGTVDIIMNISTTDSTATCWTSTPYLQSSVALFAMDANAGMPFSNGEAAEGEAAEGEAAEGEATEEAAAEEGSEEAAAEEGEQAEAASGTLIAAQASSMSAWEITNQYGEEALQTTDDLKTAFSNLSSGSVAYVAADAVIGSYVAHSSGIDAHIVGIMEAPSGYCIGVSAENADLQAVITEALNSIAGNGIVPVIERKWLGEAIDVASYAMTDDAAAAAASAESAEGESSEEGESAEEGESSEEASGEEITTEGGDVGANAAAITDDGTGAA